ncbi:hypothetical protein TNCV_2501151 [Trichonephila clavipes]|nr:hypothetical protein TNCV_2501151 [Trichonephila clavipes]
MSFTYRVKSRGELKLPSSDHYPVILEINLNTSIIKNPEHLSTNCGKSTLRLYRPLTTPFGGNPLYYESLFNPFPLKGALGSIAITPIEKAEVIADSLQVQFEPNHVAGRELFDQRIHDEVTNFINTPHVQEIEPTTPTEVLSYVQRLKPRKSPDLIRFLIV